MAQNISISEGGTAQQFGQINKLKIANSGGGTSLWVPEDEVQTKSLHVDSNGTYYASQDECYGYDEVSVNITDECFGYDDDGNLWDVDVDEDDFLEEEEMPVRIEVTTPPIKTSYIAYEPINTAGMVVTAYYADGTEYGAIPREEYTIDPLVAEMPTGEKTATSDLDTNWSQPITLYEEAYQNCDPPREALLCRFRPAEGCSMIVRYCEKRDAQVFFVGKSDGVVGYHDYYESGTLVQHPVYSAGRFVTINGKTAYYRGKSNGAYNFDYDDWYPDIPKGRDEPNNETLWTAVYGTITNPKLEVKVKWERDDGEVLEDSFEVNVSDIPVPPISGDDSGGSSGGSW